jgi:pimeloyl-ACP methyl ester carboxylesterase
LRAHPAASEGRPIGTAARPQGITRAYAEAGGIQLGLRSAGREDAPPLVVLAPAPGSAAMLSGEIEQFAKTRRVIALDAPGCGDSDALDRLAVGDMADCLASALQGLGITGADAYALHGSCAIAVALAATGRGIRRAVLEAPVRRHCAAPDYATCYAPPIEPRWDGGHLVALWHATRNRRLFRPWFDQRLEARYTGEPGLDVDAINQEVLASLESWRSWHLAWRAVLEAPEPQAGAALRLAARASDEFQRPDVRDVLPEPIVPRARRILEWLKA